MIRNVLLFRRGRSGLAAASSTRPSAWSRQTTTVYEVSIRPTRYEDGVVDLEVRTRDTWTLQPGHPLQPRRRRQLGRHQFQGDQPPRHRHHARHRAQFRASTAPARWCSCRTTTCSTAGRASASSAASSTTAPRARTASRIRSMRSTRARRGARSLSTFDRRDALFEGGNPVGDYRHFQHQGEAFVGQSNGLRGRWTHRQTLGLRLRVGPLRDRPVQAAARGAARRIARSPARSSATRPSRTTSCR